jgi:hypothetical protein
VKYTLDRLMGKFILVKKWQISMFHFFCQKKQKDVFNVFFHSKWEHIVLNVFVVVNVWLPMMTNITD